MSDISPLNYSAISWMVQKLNEVLLKNGRNEVLCVQVDERNNIVDGNLIPLHMALAGGFEPAKLIKGK